jgi:hypothetical protein
MRAETRIIWDASEIAGWQWQILVEMYPKVRGSVGVCREYAANYRMGAHPSSGSCGSIRRKFEAQFNESEREQIAALYEKFRRWANVTGAPSEHEAKPSEVALIQRAVAFFGTV